MRLRAESDVKLIDLFLNGKVEHYPFEQRAVADTLNGLIRPHCKPGESILIKTPEESNRDWFVIDYMTNYGKYRTYNQRCNTVEELHALVGKRVIDLISLADESQTVDVEPAA